MSSRIVLAALLAALLAACSGGGGDDATQVLQDNLEAQEQALQALRTRVSELADQVETVQATDPMTGISNAADRLDALQERLGSVEEDLTTQIGEADDTAAATSAQLQELTEELSGLRGDVEELAGNLDQSLADLRQRIADLEQQVEDHESSPHGPPDGS